MSEHNHKKILQDNSLSGSRNADELITRWIMANRESEKKQPVWIVSDVKLNDQANRVYIGTLDTITGLNVSMKLYWPIIQDKPRDILLNDTFHFIVTPT